MLSFEPIGRLIVSISSRISEERDESWRAGGCEKRVTCVEGDLDVLDEMD